MHYNSKKSYIGLCILGLTMKYVDTIVVLLYNNLYKGVMYMEKYIDGFDFDVSSLAYRYGKSDYVKDYKTIANISDVTLRNKEVDELIDYLIDNRENNGLFGPNDIVYINRMFGQAIRLDDREVYYSFFENLNKNFKDNTDKSSGYIVMKSIVKTIYEYYGPFDFENNKREVLTETYFDNDDNYVVPSVKNLKGQNSAACVEFASLSHNLWLMTGVKSYYVLSKDVKFDNYNDDGHAFVIVEYGGNFKIFDIAQNVYKQLKENPIELFDNSKPFVLDDKVYANASKIRNDKKL